MSEEELELELEKAGFTKADIEEMYKRFPKIALQTSFTSEEILVEFNYKNLE